MQVGQVVRNIQVMRSIRWCSQYGSPARIGDSGKVIAVVVKQGSSIVVFASDDGVRYTHSINLACSA